MGGGSKGGGTTTTTSTASFPPEFRPLAEAAVKQILAAQGALPLEAFAAPQTFGVAGIAPFTRAGFELATRTPLSTPEERALTALTGPAGQVAGRAAQLAVPTPGAQAGLGLLSSQLGAPAQFAPAPPLSINLPATMAGPSPFAGFTDAQSQAMQIALPQGMPPALGLAPIVPGVPPPAVQTQISQLQQQLAAIQALAQAAGTGGGGSSPLPFDPFAPPNAAFDFSGGVVG